MEQEKAAMPMMTEEELMAKSKEELVAWIIEAQTKMSSGECKSGECKSGECKGDAAASCKS